MQDRLRLVLASCLMLFVELALIRWTGSNVLYLSYFSNFILLGSFLGIGVGFLRARSATDLFPFAPWLLAGFVIFIRAFPVEVNRGGSDLIYFGANLDFKPHTLPTWFMLPAIFVAVAVVMAAIAHGVARLFATLRPLDAYGLDILGSLLGIGAFSLVSFLRAPPIVWGLIASWLVLLVLPSIRRAAIACIPIAALLIPLGIESRQAGVTWSPYYKISTVHTSPGVIDVRVNGVPHQVIESTADRAAREPVYFVPYDRALHSRLERVLVVGAGNGTDVAIALSKGAKHVDAVEIDPQLYRLGRKLHPDHPYQDPRVFAHIDDGRAFLERTGARYDLILFALPDSLTLVSGQSSLRLESFLFTREALATARGHLAPGGLFAMYNYYREDWLVDRLGETLKETYGHPPCVDLNAQAANLAMFTIGRDPADVSCAQTWTPSGAVVAPATDDHPFPYLRSRGLPSFYVLSIVLILLASLLGARAGSSYRGMAPYKDLFFMGAAFLLLETKSVVQFALLFGTTWFVNALVFTGILFSVLGAVLVAKRVRIARPERLYLVLLGALILAWTVPSSALLRLSVAARFPLAIAIAFSPILIANLVFAERFARTASSTAAFGANLLGAMFGGLLEYASLIIGYRALLVLVAALYGLAFLTGRTRLRIPEPGDEPGLAEPSPATVG